MASPSIKKIHADPVQGHNRRDHAKPLSIVREIGERNGASRRFLIDQTGGNTGG
jgi:hypothetical protein